jgi:hypothetical protein
MRREVKRGEGRRGEEKRSEVKRREEKRREAITLCIGITYGTCTFWLLYLQLLLSTLTRSLESL